ncbi:MAG: hypothetical protein NT004_04685 [Bacteroidetes bacterium]|nr:hypothetical protein [Bacteroidota bacterium]
MKAEENLDSANIYTETKLTLGYFCGPQDSVYLTATLLIKREENTLALEDAQVEFIVIGETSNKVIGTVNTNQEGIAKFTFSITGLPTNKDGMISYMAKFAETLKYPATEVSFSAKPASLKLFFSVEDSVKTLRVTATQKNAKREVIPISKETVMIYVPRLFSLLKIGEISLDETGTGTLEFPKEIVGDTLGNLIVMARIEEHDVYGFVEGKNTINWGVPKQYYKAEVPSRELWTPIAPMWMIITLIVMLLGVWAHYFYAVYELIMIKRLSKKNINLF